MERIKAVLTTTHVDEHGDKMTLSALESLIDQIRTEYIPVGLEHDPRIRPFGRVVAANIKPLGDDEFAVEGEIELFEPGDEIPLVDEDRQIPIHTYSADSVEIRFDRGFADESDRRLIRQIADLFHSKPQQEVKKALDPLTVLTIGGAFVLGGIAQGFLSRLGQDSYEIDADFVIFSVNGKVEPQKNLLVRRAVGRKKLL